VGNEGFLNAVYEDLLDRPLDSTGAAAWNGALAAGQTRPQVVLAIEGSLEYRTNAVQELYQDLLGRPADSTRLNSFVGFVGNGGTLEKVKEAIFGSPEYFQQRGQGTNSGFLTALYNDILGRGVDPAGAAAFGTELAQGRAHSLVASEILTSTEGLRDYV